MRKKHKLLKRKKRTPGAELALPELMPGLRGRANWHVRESEHREVPHMMNPLGGEAELVIPRSEEPQMKVARLHELLHVAHSPLDKLRDLPLRGEEKPSVSAENIYIMEELRIQTFMRYLMGVDFVAAGNISENDVSTIVEANLKGLTGHKLGELLDMHVLLWVYDDNHLSSGMSAVSKYIRKEQRRARASGNEREEKFLAQIASLLMWVTAEIWYMRWHDEFRVFEDGGIPDWKEGLLPLAEWYDTIKRSLQQIANQVVQAAAGSQPVEGEEDLGILDKRATSREESAASMLEQAAQQQEPDFDKEGNVKIAPKTTRKAENTDPEWGEMSIRTAKMTDRLPGKKTYKSKNSSTDAGVVPTQMHRALIDGQVFARKRMEAGGSVLIDDSGSMAWTSQQLNDIVLAAPASIVAAYSGQSRKGELVIVAEKQKWNPSERPKGGNNLVDFPALEWLAQQPEPRIWVTDGAVIPTNGTMEDGARQCREFCVKHNINVVEEVEHAAEIFLGKRVLYR